MQNCGVLSSSKARRPLTYTETSASSAAIILIVLLGAQCCFNLYIQFLFAFLIIYLIITFTSSCCDFNGVAHVQWKCFENAKVFLGVICVRQSALHLFRNRIGAR